MTLYCISLFISQSKWRLSVIVYVMPVCLSVLSYLLHVVLCSLVGTARPEFAVDQSLLLLQKYPSFQPGHFVHAVAMLSCWCAPASRSAKVPTYNKHTFILTTTPSYC